RGAYHIGVIEELVRQGWMEDGKGPDIIAGTSIGAINAAALASGLTVAQLQDRWLKMHTEEVHRLGDDLPAAARPLLSFLLRSVLTSDAHGGVRDTLPADERDMSAESFFSRLSKLFRTRPFRSLLDTSPWRQTLRGWMDFERINSADAPALLLAATELQSGTLRVFCNRELNGAPADTIVLDHLMASSSIPIVYPWTEIGDGKYWDGAVLANTPLEPVIDLAGDDDIDIVVVMMTPWNADPGAMRAQTKQMPQDLVQALSLTLDWALLASYRVAFEMLEHRNNLAEAALKLRRAAQQTGDESLLMASVPRPVKLPTVIAPEELMPLDWIVDYETANHQALFERGRADAARSLA
ncbi:MAG TPA: patatin-like phospholipase family protein, partial [Roseiflexaceae bacterium]|nr:patatin-like phospholipase family protein [Roseiflexaceae bacterium]